MKRRLFVAIVLAQLLPAHAASQDRPDFSGTWEMDLNRSQAPTYGGQIGRVTLVITQSPTELRIERRRAQTVSTEIYKLDGSETRIADGTATARLQGQTLVIESVRTVSGQSVTAKEVSTIASGGRELFVETIVQVQHGYSLRDGRNYGAGTNVFTRVRP